MEVQNNILLAAKKDQVKVANMQKLVKSIGKRDSIRTHNLDI